MTKAGYEWLRNGNALAALFVGIELNDSTLVSQSYEKLGSSIEVRKDSVVPQLQLSPTQ